VREISGIGTRARLDLLLAVALTVAGELEVALATPDDADHLMRALAVPVATLPLAWRRTAPLVPLAAVALALLVQASLGDYFDATPVTPLVAILIAVYSAGRYVAGAKALAVAALAVAAVAATRIAFDPAVDGLGPAVVTVIAVALPFLVGRWAHGQNRLQRELEARALRRERERERDARDAAEEERMRIAADLQAAIADRLAEIVRRTRELPGHLGREDHAAARELLGAIADTARESLADVRRVLGILRRDDQPRRLAPPAPSAAVLPAEHAARPASSARAASAPDDPPPSSGRDSSRPWWRQAARLDGVLVGVLLVAAEIELLATVPSGDRPFAALSAVAIVTPLLWRRAHPIPVALGMLAAVTVQSVVLRLDAFPVSDIAALICAAYSIGAYAERRTAVIGLVLFALGDTAHSVAFHPDAVAAAVLGGAAVPWTVGRIVRGQRLLMGEAREQAAQVERTRARDARAAVLAERMRVARELHDAVAHNISVIAIQAAGADGVVERDPARAAECAALIETVGREAIAELHRLAGLPGDARTAPPPSLARVDALAQRARDAGLPVELRVEGEPTRLAAGVDLAAFRIVQEALANAAKHAGAARAWVVVRYEQRAVELEIGDDGRGPNGTRPARKGVAGGHGLIGMRERAALYGGTLDAGRRPGGGFAVRARLPRGGS
jgi:signal transduction histidine kinase